ncbi:MAG: hypothetical protein AVDCRST_MAG66-2423, partial [uncultured Pseudonocardia sp.]
GLVADAVTRYAPGLHAAARDAHHVASPLGVARARPRRTRRARCSPDPPRAM